MSLSDLKEYQAELDHLQTLVDNLVNNPRYGELNLLDFIRKHVDDMAPIKQNRSSGRNVQREIMT